MSLLIFLFFCLTANSALAQTEKSSQASPTKPKLNIPFDGQAEAPEFPTSEEWLNTSRPVSLSDLRGKIVLLDFWTYCCINCMHVIPDLKKLEAKYAKELIVIGVHSAKFDNEKLTANIREAIKRYEIEHPVLNDKDFLVWRGYGARSWPTLVLINPQGKIIGKHSGEGVFDLFDPVIGATVEYFDAKELIDRRPINFQLEKDKTPNSVLSYPGKIAADEASKRIFFTDSNHNRVIIADLNGRVIERIGSGARGLKDGTFEQSQFFRPQGICFDPRADLIYVADTENHAIRLIDLKSKNVRTLAGNGHQARAFGAEGRGVELNSPWDLILKGDDLYIAMAGFHQLWSLNTKSLEARVFAGTGRENILDGPLKDASLAQPSGVTLDGEKIYFADSEVSAVRSAEIGPNATVKTLIGQGLFQFGDVDGKFPEARLQHCLGVTFHDGFIYVADTYNHKIKKLDPKTQELVTFIGTGKRGKADGPRSSAELNEPSGLCFAGDCLFIADANNHLIRRCDLKTGMVSTLEWTGLEKLAYAPHSEKPKHDIELGAQRISPTTRSLEFKISLPAGTKLNTEAPSRLQVTSENQDIVGIDQKETTVETLTPLIAIKSKTGKTALHLHLILYFCDSSKHGLCYFEDISLAVPVEVASDGQEKLALAYQARSP